MAILAWRPQVQRAHQSALQHRGWVICGTGNPISLQFDWCRLWEDLLWETRLLWHGTVNLTVNDTNIGTERITLLLSKYPWWCSWYGFKSDLNYLFIYLISFDGRQTLQCLRKSHDHPQAATQPSFVRPETKPVRNGLEVSATTWVRGLWVISSALTDWDTDAPWP